MDEDLFWERLEEEEDDEDDSSKLSEGARRMRNLDDNLEEHEFKCERAC